MTTTEFIRRSVIPLLAWSLTVSICSLGISVANLWATFSKSNPPVNLSVTTVSDGEAISYGPVSFPDEGEKKPGAAIVNGERLW